MKTMTTKRPAPLDAVCREAYGDENGYVEAVLRANPGLADAGRVLPAGTTIRLPEVVQDTTAEVPVVTLWD